MGRKRPANRRKRPAATPPKSAGQEVVSAFRSSYQRPLAGERSWEFLDLLGLEDSAIHCRVPSATAWNGQRVQPPTDSSGATRRALKTSSVRTRARAVIGENMILWKGSTHGQAGRRTPADRMIARLTASRCGLKTNVTPTTNSAGDYVFLIDHRGSPRTEIKVDAVVGGGHMHGGGTQSFFQKFADGTIRFLPFDFIRRENLWFVQLRRDKTWVPMSREFRSQTDLANWPPHRVLGTLSEFPTARTVTAARSSRVMTRTTSL